MLKSLSHGFFIAKYSLCKKKRHGGVDKIVDDPQEKNDFLEYLEKTTQVIVPLECTLTTQEEVTSTEPSHDGSSEESAASTTDTPGNL